MKNWSSFAVESPTSIVHQASFPMLHNCEYLPFNPYSLFNPFRLTMNPAAQAQSSSSDTRAIFVLASKHPPFAVYCNPFYSHSGKGSIFSVSSTGALAENIQNYEYQPNSSIHSTVFDSEGTYIYSADLRANKIWVHRRRGPSPELELVGSVSCSDEHDHPRWLAMHPSGTFLYVLMETGNRLCEYRICPSTNLPLYTERHYPLIPPGIPNRFQHRADVVALSHSSRCLFASSRGRDDLTGYIAAFKLHETGKIERQICLNPTPTSGGHSNAVSPSDWTDEWLAITDDQEGWLEVYRWQDEFLGRVARIRVPEPGFGMNAIWYD